MNLNVSLTDELVGYVKSKVESGRYASSSEVVREALRLMEKLERQEGENLGWLRSAWREGVASGDFAGVDADDVKAAGRRRAAGR